MRIGFVTQWFPPEPGAVVAGAIADGLAQRGHEVDVLTGFPNYPSGKLHDGYPLKFYRRDKRSQRVTVHRAPLYPSHDASSLRRMANYLSFAASASRVARRHLRQPDAWLVYSSPATAAIPALVAASRRTTPIYLLIEDLWPDSVTQSGLINGVASRVVDAILRRFCGWTYDQATGIGVISPSMRPILMDRGVNGEKIKYTPNWVAKIAQAPDTEKVLELRRSLHLVNTRLFMYAGNMGELQGLEPLVRAFSNAPSAHFLLIGAGINRPRLEEIVWSEKIDNVTFLDPQPASTIGQYIAASDVQVVSLKDTQLLRATMPSKVQSSLAAGKPILAHAAGDVARIVLDNGVGVACQPGQIENAVDAIKFFISCTESELLEMANRSRKLYDSEFSADAGLDKLEALMVGKPSLAARRSEIDAEAMVSRTWNGHIPMVRASDRRSRE